MFCGGGGGPNLRRGSKFASGYGSGGPNPLADLDRGVQIRGGSKSAVTPAVSQMVHKLGKFIKCKTKILFRIALHF